MYWLWPDQEKYAGVSSMHSRGVHRPRSGNIRSRWCMFAWRFECPKNRVTLPNNIHGGTPWRSIAMPKKSNHPDTKIWSSYFAKYFLLANLSSSAIVTSIILYYHWQTTRVFRASKNPSILDYIVPADFVTTMLTFLFGVIISIFFVLTDRPGSWALPLALIAWAIMMILRL